MYRDGIGQYQAAEFARRWDPELAAVYYRQMVTHGKTHNQAMGAVMSRLAARLYVVLKEQRPYLLRGPDGKLISRPEGRKLIQEHLRVPEEIRRARRQHQRPAKRNANEIMNTLEACQEDATTNEAAKAPQLGDAIPTRPEKEYNASRRVRQIVGITS